MANTSMMWTAFIPSLGAFIGGVTLPYAGVNLGIEGAALIIGCAVGAAIGDLLMHLFRSETVTFAGTGLGMAMDALYAGLFALIPFVLFGSFPSISPGPGVLQYLIPAISGVGLYYMGSLGVKKT
jgi:hypothetical protein